MITVHVFFVKRRIPYECLPMNIKRRAPSQERSKEMVSSILDSAKRLIGRHGYDAVSMREIAREAGISPASIYQYFDDKNAILTELASRYYDMTFRMTTALLARVQSMDDLESLLGEAVQAIHRYFSSDADGVAVWTAVIASNALQTMDLSDCVKTAQAIVDRLIALQPGLRQEDIQPTCQLMVHVLTATVRMALAMPDDQAQALLAEFPRVFAGRIRQIATRAG